MVSRNPRHSGIKSENAGIGGHTASEPLGLRAHRIPEVCKLTGLGRTSIYAAIKAGDLTARHHALTIVLSEDLAGFMRNLPTINRTAAAPRDQERWHPNRAIKRQAYQSSEGGAIANINVKCDGGT